MCTPALFDINIDSYSVIKVIVRIFLTMVTRTNVELGRAFQYINWKVFVINII